MIGQTLGHYRIVEKIGAGGMGEVYRAHDHQLDRDVALKVLPIGTLADEAARKQFRREALALAKLNHPNIETVFEFSTQNGIDFLAMELIRGQPLNQRLKAGPLPENEVNRLGRQFAEGLAAAHEQGVLHRDLKPANLMITPEGRLKILDFGLAKLVHPELGADVTQTVSTNSGTISGTVPYMSPEQLCGQPTDARSDIYAAGTVLYEMATGQRPFPQTQGAELIGAILHAMPPPPSTRTRGMSPALESVILKAIEKQPSRRYQSARELLVALEGMAAGARAPTPASMARGPRIAVAAAALALILLVGLVLGFNFRGLRDRLLHRGAAAPESARSSSPIKPRRSIAVLGFKNVAGHPEEAWLSTAFSEMLTTELTAGEQVRTIPGENVAKMKINLSLPDADSYGKDTLGKIRQNLDADEIVLGSYVPLGNGQIRLDLRLQDTSAGEILAAVSEKGSESQIDELISRAGAELRRKLGIADVSAAQELAVKATIPANSEAARFYAEGLQRLRLYDYPHARDLLEKAVAAEPNYALAHSALAAAWKGLGYDAKVKEEAQKAYDLSANFSREDRLWIEGQFHEFSSDWPHAVENYRALFEFFPDNLDYGLRLASAQTSAGKGSDALATVALLHNLPAPSSEDPRIALAEAVASASLGDFKRQRTVAAETAKAANAQGARLLAAQALLSECSALRNLGQPKDSIPVCQQASHVFADAGEKGGMAKALNTIAVDYMYEGDLFSSRMTYEEALATNREIGDKRGEAMVLNNLAGVLREQAELGRSRQMLEMALANFRLIDEKPGVVHCLENIGIILVDQGKPAEARKRLDESLALANKLGNRSLAAYALELSGQALMAQGNFPAAHKNLEESLAMMKESGAQRTIAETDTDLANLSIEERQYARAESFARESADIFHKGKESEGEAGAYAVLCRALLAEGNLAAARDARDRALALSKTSDDPVVRLAVNIEAARVSAAPGKPPDIDAARNLLQDTISEAGKAGITRIQFEAQLALGEIEIKSGNAATGRARLAALEKDANSTGMFLIARKAAAARK